MIRHENVVLFMGACLEPPNLAVITRYTFFAVCFLEYSYELLVKIDIQYGENQCFKCIVIFVSSVRRGLSLYNHLHVRQDLFSWQFKISIAKQIAQVCVHNSVNLQNQFTLVEVNLLLSALRLHSCALEEFDFQYYLTNTDGNRKKINLKIKVDFKMRQNSTLKINLNLKVDLKSMHQNRLFINTIPTGNFPQVSKTPLFFLSTDAVPLDQVLGLFLIT